MQHAALVGLWLALVFPSTSVVDKFLGVWGVTAYALAAAGVLWAARRGRVGGLRASPSERQAFAGVWVMWAVLGVLFWAAYPIVDAGVVGAGSDRDDALQLGVQQILAGRFPYEVRTYLDNPLSPLPGAFLLSAPFAVLGTLAWQNLLWLGGFVLLSRWLLADWRGTFLLFLALWCVSPVLLHGLVTGSDLIANSLAALILLVLMVYPPRADQWIPWIAAGLLGVALSWRANFLFLIPLLFSALAVREGWRAAIEKTTLVLAVFIAVTLPFWLYDPAGFSPLSLQNKANFKGLFPLSAAAIPALTAALSVALAFADNSSPRQLLRNSFWVMLFPVVGVVLLTSIQSGSLELRMAGYALCALFFGGLAYWPGKLRDSPCANRSSTGGSTRRARPFLHTVRG